MRFEGKRCRSGPQKKIAPLPHCPIATPQHAPGHAPAPSVVLSDGSELPAVLVVFANGSGSMNRFLADLISPEVDLRSPLAPLASGASPRSVSPPLRRLASAAMAHQELLRFLARVRADGALRQRVVEAITADEVSLIAQELGFLVSGSDILRFHGQSASGLRITRIDHPGEYPGRYY